MTVILKPFKYGMINTYIKLGFETEQGVIHQIELPVIGLVTQTHQLITEHKGNNFYDLVREVSVDGQVNASPFFGFLPAEPVHEIILYDENHIKEYINSPETLMPSVTLKDKPVDIPVIVEGNWHGVATSSLEVISWLEPALDFSYNIDKYSFVESM